MTGKRLGVGNLQVNGEGLGVDGFRGLGFIQISQSRSDGLLRP